MFEHLTGPVAQNPQRLGKQLDSPLDNSGAPAATSTSDLRHRRRTTPREHRRGGPPPRRVSGTVKGSEQDLVRIDASRRIRPDRSNPNVLEAALAYATEAEGIDDRASTRWAGRWARAASRCGSPRSTRCSTRSRRVGWSPASRSGWPTTPTSTTACRPWRPGSGSTRTSSSCSRPGASPSRSPGTARFTSTPRSTSGRGRCSAHPPVWHHRHRQPAHHGVLPTARLRLQLLRLVRRQARPDGGSSTGSGRRRTGSARTRNPYRIGLHADHLRGRHRREGREALQPATPSTSSRRGSGPSRWSGCRCPAASTSRACSSSSATPATSGIYPRMREARFAELVDAGSVICGSPATVRDQLPDRPRVPHRQPARDAPVRLDAAASWPRTTSACSPSRSSPTCAPFGTTRAGSTTGGPKRLGGVPHPRPTEAVCA